MRVRACAALDNPDLAPRTNRTLGDARVLDAARQSIRAGFRDKASLPASDPTVQPAIIHAEEVASFLKANLVQGKREGNTYSKCFHFIGI